MASQRCPRPPACHATPTSAPLPPSATGKPASNALGVYHSAETRPRPQRPPQPLHEQLLHFPATLMGPMWQRPARTRSPCKNARASFIDHKSDCPSTQHRPNPPPPNHEQPQASRQAAPQLRRSISAALTDGGPKGLDCNTNRNTNQNTNQHTHRNNHLRTDLRTHPHTHQTTNRRETRVSYYSITIITR